MTTVLTTVLQYKTKEPISFCFDMATHYPHHIIKYYVILLFQLQDLQCQNGKIIMNG